MTFGKKTLFSVLLGVDLLANVLELTHVNFLGTSTLVSFCTIILLPGFLISLILRIRKISFWENLLFVVGLSIAFLEFGGLLLNILLPLFGINNPLAFQNLVIGFDVYTLLLFIFAWIRTKQLVVQIQLPRRSRIEKALYAVPLFFSILATLGAIVLNNGGSATLTIILLGAIAFYSLLMVLLRDKIAVDLFPYALFFMGMACLFTTSLRSWYITGHDIEREFYVFQLTNIHHIWKMAFYQDAYNACLSITILPTILTNLLSIQDMYVYKVIFQILFATSPVLVFFIIRNYTIPILAFLSAFFFMSFPTFFNDMPMLNRQEIGFIFFGLVMYMMLKRTQTRQFYRIDDILPLSELTLSMRKILFIIFALSVIVSHYSTNFVLLALVTFVYVSTLIIFLPLVKNTYASLLSNSRYNHIKQRWSRVKNHKNHAQFTMTPPPNVVVPKSQFIKTPPLDVVVLKSFFKQRNTFTNNMFLSLPLILLLFSATYFWNTLYTNTSNHTGSVIAEVVNSIFIKSNSKSSDISYSIFFSPKLDPNQELQNYIQSIIRLNGLDHTGKVDANQFYSKATISKYRNYIIPQKQLAPTPLGNVLSSFHISVFNIQSELRSLSASFMQIFVFIGLLVIFFIKNKKSFDIQYLLLCIGAIFLLILETILPAISAEYGILRMFQQLLFLLSLPIVFSLSSLLFFVKEQKRILFAGMIAIIFFLNLTGFISHLTGYYYPQMTLDNAGSYYDAYYVHRSDIIAIIWLSENDVNNDPIVADQKAIDKLLVYGNINASNENFPAVIPKKAYVYLQISKNSVVSIGDTVLYYSSDKLFLEENKNLIYSNGEDGIFR